jgi:hypothetical protein
METYEVTRKLLSWGPTYEVRAQGSQDVLMTVKGKLFITKPNLTMVKGTEGEELAHMSGNFSRSEFEMTHANQEKLATLSFSGGLASKKSFTLRFAGQEYQAVGGLFATKFACNEPSGQPVFEVAWELSWKDKFILTLHGKLPTEVAVLATVGIHQKYYEGGDIVLPP